MADHYLLFSEMVPCKTREERDWFADQMAESKDEDGEERRPCEFLVEDAGVWVYSDEYGDVSRLAEIVCRWQHFFHIEEPWSLEYADTCSKPRINEFSGGAVLCWHGEAHYMHTSAWIDQKKKQLEGASQ